MCFQIYNFTLILIILVSSLHNVSYAVFPETIKKGKLCESSCKDPEIPPVLKKNKKDPEADCKATKGKKETKYKILNMKFSGNLNPPLKDTPKMEDSLGSSEYIAVSSDLYKKLTNSFSREVLDLIMSWERGRNTDALCFSKLFKPIYLFYRKYSNEIASFSYLTNTHNEVFLCEKYAVEHREKLVSFFERINDLILFYLDQKKKIVRTLCEGEQSTEDEISAEMKKNIAYLFSICLVSKALQSTCKRWKLDSIRNERPDFREHVGDRNRAIKKYCKAQYKPIREEWGNVKAIIFDNGAYFNCISVILYLFYKNNDLSEDALKNKANIILTLLENKEQFNFEKLYAYERDVINSIGYYISILRKENKIQYEWLCKSFEKDLEGLVAKCKFFDEIVKNYVYLSYKFLQEFLLDELVEKKDCNQTCYNSEQTKTAKKKTKKKQKTEQRSHFNNSVTGFGLQFYLDVLKNNIPDDRSEMDFFGLACRTISFGNYINGFKLQKILSQISYNKECFSELISLSDILFSNTVSPIKSKGAMAAFIPNYEDIQDKCLPEESWLPVLVINHIISSCNKYLGRVSSMFVTDSLKEKEIELILKIAEFYLLSMSAKLTSNIKYDSLSNKSFIYSYGF